jgi:hypothetical protein
MKASCAVIGLLLGVATLSAQTEVPSVDSPSPPINLVLETGRPLRVALDERLSVHKVGQRVSGTVVESVYVYDRIVIPAGTRIFGHIQTLENLSKTARLRGMLNGDFTPSRRLVLAFDTLLLNGERISLDTVALNGIPDVKRAVAGEKASSKPGASGRARAEIARAKEGVTRQVKDALSAIKQPGRMARLRDDVLAKLPVHPQIVSKGTVYDAQLLVPLPFGSASPVERAQAGTMPAPSSVLTARLVTPLDSSKTPRGGAVSAVLTEPVFSGDHHLILPEGTELRGSVTFAKAAGHFRRNGQLRFLFEQVEEPNQPSAKLLAALYSVEASSNAHLKVDEEGGTTLTNSNTRFIAPAVAIVSLVSMGHTERHTDADLGQAPTIETRHGGGGGAAGFFGLGVAGVLLGRVSRPVGIGLGVAGVARILYSTVFGKGHEVTFVAGTPIQLQLAPGPIAPE